MTTLQKINKYFVFVGIAAFALSVLLLGTPYVGYFTYSIVQFIVFSAVLWNVGFQSEDFFVKKNLILLTAVCLVFGVAGNLILSQSIKGNLFVFSEGDATFYYYLGIWFRELPLSFMFGYVGENYPVDDWGGTILIPLILRIAPTKILLNIIYVVIGVFTSVIMYDIGKRVMNARYAFFAAFTFSISSFMVFLYSSALKEPFLSCLSVLSFYFYYMYWQDKDIKYLVYAFISAVLMIFFRPAVTFFFVVAVGVSLLISLNASSVKLYIVALLFGLVAVVFWNVIGNIWNTYVGSDGNAYYGRLEYMSSESMGVGGSMVISAISAMIGPFPAMLPKVTSEGISYISLYGPGLIYRLILAFPFWIGVYVCFKNRVIQVLPLMLFTLIEMLSLSFILEGLELRLQIAHMPMVYIFSFWMLYIIDSKQWVPNRLVATLFNFWPIAVGMLAILWNFR